MKLLVGGRNLFLLIFLITFRVMSSLFINTYFSADEYYQGIEIAHSLHFPDHPHIIPWEWEPKHSLRGFTHPMILSMGYYVMDFVEKMVVTTNESSSSIMNMMGFLSWWMPIAVQSVCTGLSDYFLFLIVVKYLKLKMIAYLTLLISLTNWFHLYCGVRTFSNTMEMNIVLIAVYLFPIDLIVEKCNEDNCHSHDHNHDHHNHSQEENRSNHMKKLNKKSGSLNLWMFFAGFGCVIRPTSAIIYLPLFLFQLFRERNFIKYVLIFIGYVVIWLAISIQIDSNMYGQFTIVILNFLKFNVVENLAHLYGTQPWHWYWSQGLPVMLLTHFPLYVYINFINKEYSRKYWKLNCVILFPVLIYSMQSHKEFRFIYPILPLCFISIGDFIHNKVHHINSIRGYRLLLVLMTVIQMGAVFYLGRIHQSAPLKVMNHLRGESYKQQQLLSSVPPPYTNDNTAISNNDSMVVHLLMPCHHLPGHAFLYEGLNKNQKQPIQLYHLDCSPFDGDNSQADQFYANPLEFVKTVSNTHNQAHYVVLYDHVSVQPVVEFLMKQHNFTINNLFFHMHFTHDSRMGRQIIILKK